MSVIYKADEQKFTAEQVLWQKRELVDAIIRSALIGQTEGFIDMIMDGESPGEITRASVNETLRGVPESAQEFLNDVLGDLEYAIKERMKAVRYGAAVIGIKYDLAGDVKDVEVDVSVNFE